MANSLTVAVLGAPGFSEELGKKSTQSDITLYHRVGDAHALTLVEPTQYPEKFAPLLYALAMSDRAVLIANALDRALAETAATADLFDLPLEVRYGPAVGADELARAFRGLRLATSPARPLDLLALREELGAPGSPGRPGPVRVLVDHAFPVKGVGTVALGFVQQGTLTTHAGLRLYPTAKSVEVRSIQVHDVDVREAATGERVGIALKGVDADELSRGQILAPEGTLSTSQTLRGTGGRRCPYYRGDLTVGARLHALIGAQFVPAALIAIDATTVGLETDRPVAVWPEASVIVADLDVPSGPRCVGSWKLS